MMELDCKFSAGRHFGCCILHRPSLQTIHWLGTPVFEQLGSVWEEIESSILFDFTNPSYII